MMASHFLEAWLQWFRKRGKASVLLQVPSCLHFDLGF